MGQAEFTNLTQDLEVYRQVAESAQMEVGRIHEMLTSANHELEYQTEEHRSQLRERQEEYTELQTERNTMESELHAAMARLKQALLAPPVFEATGKEELEINTMGLVEVVELAQTLLAAKPAGGGADEAELEAVRAQLAARNELLSRVMKHLKAQDIDIGGDMAPADADALSEINEASPGAGARRVTGDGGLAAEFDEQIDQGIRENAALKTQLDACKAQIKGLQAELEGYAAREAAAANRPASPRAKTEPRAATEEIFIEVPVAAKQVLDDLGMAELLEELKVRPANQPLPPQ